MEVDVVSPERGLFSGEATEVYARSLDGEIGILPGHQPALLALDVAPVRIQATDGTEHVIAVHNGFLEFRDDRLTVLADVAERAEDIDVDRARRRAQELERDLASEDTARTRSALARHNLRADIGGA